MTATLGDRPEPAVTTARRRVVYGHGYALVLSSALTSGIGLLFWIVAARGYDEAVLGRNAALVSAIMFLAGVAQLNLMNVLIRFVPVAGPRARRLVGMAYLVGGGLAGLVGLVFALGVRWWAPELGVLLHGPTQIAGTAAACAVWAIFVMQDGVLTAVGRARVVPVENLVFSVLKLGLLAALATTLPSGGITVSWMAATGAAVVATTAYLFCYALPAHQRTHATTDRFSVRALAGYLGGDFVGATCWLACTQLLPVLVLGVLGARTTAVFAMTWTIAYALYLVPAAMGQSLVAHAAAGTDSVAAARSGVERRSLLLLTPAVVVLIVAGPWILRLLGPGYAGSGHWVLALMAASALPNVIVAAEVSQARVLRRVGVVAALLAALSALVLASASVLMRIFGVEGVGLALLGSQTLVAAALLLGRSPRIPRPIRGPFAGPRNRALLRRIAPIALDPRSWRRQGSLHGLSDSAVAPVGPRNHSVALLKVADTDRGRAALRTETRTLVLLHEDDRLAGWRHRVPAALDSGDALGATFSLQQLLPGRDARGTVTDPHRRPRFTADALAVLAQLHERTARLAPVDEELLRKHVTDPAGLVRAVVPARLGPAVDRLVAELSRGLRDRCLPVGWVHGDYSPDNILLSDDGQLTGVVDWGQATDTGLVAVDLVTLLLTTEVTAGAQPLGTVVEQWLTEPSETAELRLAPATFHGDPVPARTLVLLGWLHLVAANLAKSARYGAHPIWLRRNVIAVLRTLHRDLP
ncbi:MAG TPA: phosphotransferase [Amycolatopsis sp.]|nr:phosphotransferase [Amycolatopsis sp.]